MNPKRKEKDRQVLHLPYVSTNKEFCIDNYNYVKILCSTCLPFGVVIFLCREDFETLKILPSLPSIATIIKGKK